MARVDDQISDEFHRWELRGRGWQVHGEPVHIEPPFRPFPGHVLPPVPRIDDGRRQTALSSLFRKLAGNIEAPPVIPVPEEELEPEPLSREPLVEILTSLPAKLDIGPEAFAQFLRSLALCAEPVAFELLGLPSRVTAQFAAHADDAPLLRRQLQAYFPEVTFQKAQGILENAWIDCEGSEGFVAEFGLEREFMFPLATGKLDPFVGIIGALSELAPGELGLFQVLWQPLAHPWADSIIRSVTHADGKPFFVNAPELASAAETKASLPLYAAVVRIAVQTDTWDRSLRLARDIAGSLRVFANPNGNALIPLSNDEYPDPDHVVDVIRRQSRRPGMILTSEELTGFVHIPGSTVRSAVLERDVGKTKAAPDSVRQTGGVLLGHNTHAGETVPVRLSADQRVHHTHIIGVPGTGKSTLLFNLIRQDIEKGDGVGVLDAHGDLIDLILGCIPESRIDDVVLVDLADTEYPIGFNILSAHSDIEKTLLASDLVSCIRRLSSSWGDQLNVVLQNAILAFLESARGGTLSDLRRFLIEPAFRAEHLTTVTDPEIIYYWVKVFPQLTGNRSVGPVLVRLQEFMGQKPIRNMVSQPENRLDVADIMDSGKIFLARLSEGLGGAENSYLLGTLLVSKFQQIAMSRQAQKASARRDFWLYIDEFDHFITPSMAEILKGARKYRLGLTLAHQELNQLEIDPKVASAVEAHPFTRVVFRVGDQDAKRLAEGFSFFEAQNIKNLETFHALVRVERSECDFNLTIEPPPRTVPPGAESRKERIIAASRAKYARPRAEVEAELLRSLGGHEPAQPPVATKAKPAGPAPLPEPSVDTGSTRKQVTALPIAQAISESPAPPEVPVQAGETFDSEDESRHEEIKRKIQAEAENLDYTVTPEKQDAPTDGRPDLTLSLGARLIACEVSETTHVTDEVAHIHDRLQAGFTQVAVVSVSRRKLDRIKEEFARSVSGAPPPTVGFYSPAEFISQLFQWAGSDPEGARVERGKRRKRKMPLDPGNLSVEELKLRKEQMLDNLQRALKR